MQVTPIFYNHSENTASDVENFKYLGAIFNADNNSQTHLQQRIKMLTKHTLCYRIFSKIKTYPKS